MRNSIILLLIALLLVTGVAWADGGYELSRSVIGGGGGPLTGGDFVAFSTIGQPLAGDSEGDGYSICSGFNCGAAAATPVATLTPTATASPIATPTPTASPTPNLPLYLPLVQT